MRGTAPIVVVLAAGLGATGLGQADLTSRTDLVVMSVRVLGRGGQFVEGVSADEFRVAEDGVPQRIGLIVPAEEPAAVGIILDNSASMWPLRGLVEEAVQRFVHVSRADDEWFVLHFNERVWPGIHTPSGFTTDPLLLRQAVAGLLGRGQTALYDALLGGLAHLRTAGRPKQALIVFSDGRDTASDATLDAVMTAVARSDAAIYTVGLEDQTARDGRLRVLRDVARASGGESYAPAPADLRNTLSRIAIQIRSSYIIGYESSNTRRDGAFRAVSIDVRRPGVKLVARHRRGYLAPRD